MCQLVIELLGVDNKRSQKLLIFETEFKNYSIFDMGETSENVCLRHKIMSLFSEMPNWSF